MVKEDPTKSLAMHVMPFISLIFNVMDLWSVWVSRYITTIGVH